MPVSNVPVILAWPTFEDLAHRGDTTFLSPAGGRLKVYAELIEHAHAALIDDVL